MVNEQIKFVKVPYTIFIYMMMMDKQYAYHKFSVNLLNSEKQLCGQNIFRSKNKQKLLRSHGDRVFVVYI